MMNAEAYLGRSRLFRRLKNECHGQLIEPYAARLVELGLARYGTWRSLNLVGDLLSWIASSRAALSDLDERMVERYLRSRTRKRSIYPGDRLAFKRFLSVLRDAGMIAPAEPPRITPHDQIFAEFSGYLQRERGLAPGTITSHLPTIRRFLCEVCPAGAKDLRKINHADVVRYVERHARDGSPKSVERAGIRGFAHHGAHIFRHSLATELLRSGATLSEIGQLLLHKGHDTTRIYAKVDIDALRTLSLPWLGGAQ